MVKVLPFCGRQATSCLEYYTILYMLLVVSQMMLDTAYFQSIIKVPTESEAGQINLFQCIIIAVHCLQDTLQFFYGFDLYKATVKKSYRRARNWQTLFFCLLAVEVSMFFAYIALASFFSIFTYVTAVALLFKIYLIWPLRIFIEECHEVCVPLAQAVEHRHRHHHHHHLLQEDNATTMNKPGPSGSSSTKPVGEQADP